MCGRTEENHQNPASKASLPCRPVCNTVRLPAETSNMWKGLLTLSLAKLIENTKAILKTYALVTATP